MDFIIQYTILCFPDWMEKLLRTRKELAISFNNKEEAGILHCTHGVRAHRDHRLDSKDVTCIHKLKNKYLPNIHSSYILYYFGTKKVNLKQVLIKLGHCKLLNYQTRLNKSIRSAVQYSFQTMLHLRCQRLKTKFSLNSRILF